MNTAVAMRIVGVLLTILVFPACFDVQDRDAGPANYPLDDFEDGDTLPTSVLFDRWQCYTFNPDLGIDPDQTVSCGLESPGNQSAHAMATTFHLHDGTQVNADGTPAGTQYAGSSLQSIVADRPVDVTGFYALVFDMKVDFFTPPPGLPTIDVQLGCNSVTPDNLADVGQMYFDVAEELTVSNTWRTVQVPLSNFKQRSDELNHFAGGPLSCLKVVGNIHFEVVEPLIYGQSGSGTFHIDNVYLQKNAAQ